jgi:hypothetical protein
MEEDVSSGWAALFDNHGYVYKRRGSGVPLSLNRAVVRKNNTLPKGAANNDDPFEQRLLAKSPP